MVGFIYAYFSNIRTFEHTVWPMFLLLVVAGQVTAGEMKCVRVADNKHGFVLSKSGFPFIPWGFNYDHDENGRLLEDYWDKEWPKVEEDFREMKQLGANVVRIHLQVGKFMTGQTSRTKPTWIGLAVWSLWPRRSACTSTSPAWLVTARRTCPIGTTASANKSGGMSRPGSGRRWPGDASRAQRSSATI